MVARPVGFSGTCCCYGRQGPAGNTSGSTGFSRLLDSPGLWLVPVVLVVVLGFSGKLPVVDEESYLFMARETLADPMRPYDWWRVWQPWAPAGSSFFFAHPPLQWLWVGLCCRVLGSCGAVDGLVVLRLAVSLPPAMLLGWSVASLARSSSSRPGLASLLWIGSPITVLGLSSGFMVDLPATAMGTAALALWASRKPSMSDGATAGSAASPGGTSLGLVVVGLLLGLAVSTKYPMLVLAPVLLVDAARRSLLRTSWPLWLTFVITWGGLESWLWYEYDQPHLLAVLLSASQVERGAVSGRAAGSLARLGLALAPLLFVGGWGVLKTRRKNSADPPGPPGSLKEPPLFNRSVWFVPMLVLGALLWAAPQELGPFQWGVLLVFVSMGSSWVVLALSAALSRRSPGTAFLGLWVLMVLAGVLVGHNFASGRYLLPLMAPLACLVADLVPVCPALRWVRGVLVLAWGLLAISMGLADMRLAAAASHLAEQVASRYPPGFFVGEWTFRWRMEQEGWSPVEYGRNGAEGLRAGDLVVTPRNSVAAPLPWERLRLVEVLESSDRSPLRLVDVPGNIGYYAETLGPLPVGLGREPLEVVRVYRVVKETDR